MLDMIRWLFLRGFFLRELSINMRKRFVYWAMWMVMFVVMFCNVEGYGQLKSVVSASPKYRVLALCENGGHHVKYSAAAKLWLNQLAKDSVFVIDYISDARIITTPLLARYQLFIQLDYPPYGWGDTAVKAFETYITSGKGGWIGFHHATLLGEFDGYKMWDWFSKWMGGIKFKDYIPAFAQGNVIVEDSVHPVMKGVAESFVIEKEEWYTYDKSPRGNVHLLASVDEGSYKPDGKVKMGDHPVVWTSGMYPGRNVYIFMGHGEDLWGNESYRRMVRNAVMWGMGR